MKNDVSERTNSQETDNSKSEEVRSSEKSKVSYEEKFKRYEEEIETLKNVVKKLAKDEDEISVMPTNNNGEVAALTSRLVMARLALGELDPTEAYKILEDSNALATYTIADLYIVASGSKKKANPMKRLKWIFSSKRSSQPVPPEYEES